MTDAATGQSVKVRAYSPGRYPILVVELASGGLRTAYFETGYDLGQTKEVGEDWLRDNAIGRHSFVEVSPPRADATGFARRLRQNRTRV